MTRRSFLQQGTLCIAGLASGRFVSAAEAEAQPLLRIGLMTDLHYADKPASKTRFYQEALGKLDEAVAVMNEEKPAAVVELGDFIDQAAEVDQEIEWLKTMESHYARLTSPRHYVLGNHCVTTLTKQEFATHTGLAPEGFSSFDIQGARFILLDACYRQDGVPYGRNNAHWRDCAIPRAELSWLESELAQADGPVIILAHQRLDLDKAHAVTNAAEVRALLEKSGKVTAVFQGHSHKNDLQDISGIPYCTLAAMIEGSGAENNSYSLLDVLADGSLRLKGFRKQTPHQFAAA